MSSETKEIITTIHPVKKRGVKMEKSVYDTIARFIVDTIKQTENIDLPLLLSISEERYPECKNINWYIYQVKLDLEARGFIRNVALLHLKTQGMKLTPTGIRNFSR